MKTAVVTGVTGQDGAYLSRFLVSKGYRVVGTIRRSATQNLWRLEELDLLDNTNFSLEEFDLTDPGAAFALVSKCKPAEIYNLAAQSFVGASFSQPMTTAQITGLGVLNLLEAIRLIDTSIKFYQASTSEMFGKVAESPQRETTPFYPRSPYGVAKLYGHWITLNYRDSYDIFACSGILFNHESPLRGTEFVTRKISSAVAQIEVGSLSKLKLGNLDARRDWGYAPEYVEGMWRMMQASSPETYVLASGRTETVRSFVQLAFREIDIELAFEGTGTDEVGFDVKTGRELIAVDPEFFRPAEVDLLHGDYSKANEELGWSPSTGLEQLCKIMVSADRSRLRKGLKI